ncbi:MAG: sulfotransferase domain-containing protein [Pseudomonadota bacterium]
MSQHAPRAMQQDLRRIIWIASFPKSGNTWLRTFLAKVLVPDNVEIDINSLRRFTTADVRQDFFDRASGRNPFVAEDFDDWLRTRQKALALIAASKPGMHFVKTHSRLEAIGKLPLIPPRVTAGALYVLRNPFDVAQSYARHLGLDLDRTIEMMMNPKALNASDTRIFEVIGRWDEHIDTWLKPPGLMRHVMRYEDMHADPHGTFTTLLSFMKADVPAERVARALEETSFDALKSQEEKTGFIERPGHMKAFFAKGRAGSWREELTPAQIARLRKAFLPAIERWYPEMVEETAEAARA